MKFKAQSSRSNHVLFIVLSFLFAFFLTQTIKAQEKTKGGATKEVYTGTVFFIGGPRTVGTASRPFTLTITCTTPDEEVGRLAGILKADGQDALLKAISKEKCGVFQLGNNVGRDINAVRISTTEEGDRKITMLFERWLEFFEVRYGTRSQDYPFTYIELYIDSQGKGTGTMIPAARIQFKENNTVEIENFGAYPARLMNVKLSK
jgi:hypothetical protein